MSDKPRLGVYRIAPPQEPPLTLEETRERNAWMRLTKVAKLRQKLLSDQSKAADRNEKVDS